MRSFERWTILGCSTLLMLGSGAAPAWAGSRCVWANPDAPGGPHDSAEKHKATPSAVNVVVWLSPVKVGAVMPAMPARQPVYRLVQKDKMFTPHLLVVPTGSQVEFPNKDPLLSQRVLALQWQTFRPRAVRIWYQSVGAV